MFGVPALINPLVSPPKRKPLSRGAAPHLPAGVEEARAGGASKCAACDGIQRKVEALRPGLHTHTHTHTHACMQPRDSWQLVPKLGEKVHTPTASANGWPAPYVAAAGA